MNNEEPIELAHFPAAKPPKPGEKPKIERDDFPAPPYPYTDPGKSLKIQYSFFFNLNANFSQLLETINNRFAERRKRWSDTYKGVPDSDDETDGKTEKEIEDSRLKKEEEELSKIATGIGKVFLKEVKEREKLKKIKAANLDPRNASR